MTFLFLKNKNLSLRSPVLRGKSLSLIGILSFMTVEVSHGEKNLNKTPSSSTSISLGASSEDLSPVSKALKEGSALLMKPEDKSKTLESEKNSDKSVSEGIRFGKGSSVEELSIAPLVEKLLPAVVNISTEQTVSQRRGLDTPQFPQGSPFELFQDFVEGYRYSDRSRKITSLGSGFIIHPDGYIVTNNHVIGDAEEIKVILHDDTELKATIVGRDSRTDLALVKVEATKKLPFLEWGDSSKSRVGDQTIVIGNPFGLGGTVTTGIISSRARDISRSRMAGVSEYIEDFIQTDASMNIGNSGGPMMNMKGQVIGINTAILSPNGTNIGIGFAIPSAVARHIIDQLQDHGRTNRGWIGVHIQKITQDMSENLGLSHPKGALVGVVAPNGPAAKAGLKSWDVILNFNGIQIPDPRKLMRIVGDTPVGKEIDIVIWRNRKEMSFKITVGQLDDPKDQPLKKNAESKEKPMTKEVLGLLLSPITTELRNQLDLKPETQGVLVMDIKPNSPAEHDVRPDDIIVEVAQVPVKTPEDIQKKVEEVKKAGEKSILIQINRDDELHFIALRLQRPGS